MEVRSLELPLKGFGAQPTDATVQVSTLTFADRFKRAATIFGISLIGAMIALPIPLVHFVLVPAALALGIGFALVKLRQAEIFRAAHGRCPFCGTEQDFSLMGRFRLPKKVYCGSCQRQLILEEPTTARPRSPT